MVQSKNSREACASGTVITKRVSPHRDGEVSWASSFMVFKEVLGGGAGEPSKVI